MSYCRWSSNDFSCDLYCYQSSEGWVTHVAANRPVGQIPKGPDWGRDTPQELSDAINAQMTFLNDCGRAPIGLPNDGATFLDGTLEDFRARLILLKEVGYRFPEGVLADVEVEIQEQGTER